MKIRLSQTEDIPAIMAIYDVADQFMKDQAIQLSGMEAILARA